MSILQVDPVPGAEAEVPPRALLHSLFALVVAGLAGLLWPDSLRELAALVWLLALVPSFLFAYYRGWEGAASGLLVAMIVLIAIEIVPALLVGTDVDWRIAGGVTVVFIGGSLGAGWIAEMLGRQKADALKLAHRDPLTGLANRRMLEVFLQQHFEMAQRHQGMTIALFDLDKFKNYNDTHGHTAGDDALRAFADVLREQTRRSDIAGRFGGEEFLTLLPHEGIEGGRVYAERVRGALALHQMPTGDRITVSVGLATSGPTMASAVDLVRAADAALYMAKAAGGNRVEPGAAHSREPVETTASESK